VKILSISSVKSFEKSASKLFQVLATKPAAFFHTAIKSISSQVSFIYELTFFIAFILYQPQRPLFEVINTQRVFLPFHF